MLHFRSNKSIRQSKSYYGLYQAIRNNIVDKNTIELVVFFHKKTTKLVFLLPNTGQLSFKVLSTKN